MTIIEQLEDADKTLAADGYKEYSYVRIAISEAIQALRQPPVNGSLPSVQELREISKDRPNTFMNGALYIIDLIE